MDELAEFLLKKESITGKEFMEIFNRAKGIEPEEEKAEEEKTEEEKTEEDGETSEQASEEQE